MFVRTPVPWAFEIPCGNKETPAAVLPCVRPLVEGECPRPVSARRGSGSV